MTIRSRGRVRSPTGRDNHPVPYESTHDPIDVVVDTSNDTNTITVGSCRGDQGRRYRASTVPPKRGNSRTASRSGIQFGPALLPRLSRSARAANQYMADLWRETEVSSSTFAFARSSSARCCSSESGFSVKARSAFSHSVRSSK